jgi:endonuclease/exonuclease/phosphatase family metal-dependent hydrolase
MLLSLLISITVLTWNTGRMDYTHKPPENQVLQYLVSQDADVVCLQEADVYKDGRYLTLADVKQVMSKKYPYSYLDFSKYDKRHQFGLMVWSKYPLIHKQTLQYEWKGNISNRCDIVVGTDTFRLINNHLQSYSFKAKDLEAFDTKHNYEGFEESYNKVKQKWSRAVPLRNEQARVVRREIDDSPYPVIVVGDFNAIELSYVYWHISSGLHDAWRSLHWFEYGATCVHRGIGVRIDYIFCSDPLVPIRSSVPQPAGSDHHPVIATLAW